MTYTAITIGPIIKTLSMARKPRELWAASYMFSHLMKCIIDAVGSPSELISPAKLGKTASKVGLYPDRVFIKNIEQSEAGKIVKTAFDNFINDTMLNPDVINYFNIMYVSVETEKDCLAVSTLNQKLDVMELSCKPTTDESIQDILSLIKKSKNSPLILKAFRSDVFPVETLAEIATKELSVSNKEDRNESIIFSRLVEEVKEKNKEKYENINDEDIFYQVLKSKTLEAFKTYHKYVCVVQADGDNMGSIVSKITDNKLVDLSGSLLQFGKKACDIIEDYGGLPIYAGGDDLLFIAPVNGKNNKSIFELIDQIDDSYKMVQTKVIEFLNSGANLKTSMSYGISINYYKFPLYESLVNARNLLFDNAKKVVGKNALAWKLQKHSGSSFEGQLSKTDKTYKLFKILIQNSLSENLVKAVSHKIRESESLLELWINESQAHINLRLEAFFKKTLESDSKNPDEQKYLTATRELMTELYKDANIEIIIKKLYGMLRTSIFIQGEEENHD